MPHTPHQLRRERWPRLLGAALGLPLLAAAALWLVGDLGLTQGLLDGAERRALAGHSTLADRYGLRLLYAALQAGGQWRYPQAAALLAHYCAGGGDTLRFDARPLLRHPEVREALRQHKPGITFRHRQVAGPFYTVRRTDWALYYAFDLLYIRQSPGRVVLFDNYFFQPLARRSYTRFRIGRTQIRLNDGLIRVAYPQARPFVAYGEARVPLAVAAAGR